MSFEEYIARFRLLRRGLEDDERLLQLVRTQGYHSFLSRLEGAGLGGVMLSPELLEERMQKKRRIYERYAVRIAKACSLIDVPPIREYAVCRYLYGFTHEDIAEASFYCVRTVYRHAKTAEKMLFKNLLFLQPKPRRIPPKRFVPSGRLPRRDYSVPSATRSLLRCAGKDSMKMEKLRRRHLEMKKRA